MTEARIAIVDVGVGNLRSVERALRRAMPVGSDSLVLTRDPGIVREARAVVFPGQGAFGDCMKTLGRDGGALARTITDGITAGRPYLGICLGLQVLFERSDEAPGASGLGVFQGTVRRLRGGTMGSDPVAKVPHVGWNTVVPRQANPTARRVFSSGPGEYFYFVHSYHVVPQDEGLVAGTSTHGETFVSAVARGSVLGVQFHPEKSQTAGLSLLERYVTEVLSCG